MVQFEAELKLAEEAAREAGAWLRSRHERGARIKSSQGHDIKLQADEEAERLLLAKLRARSSYPALAEESGESGAAAAAGFRWVVDPLDGTLNYSRAIPVCAVSVALCRAEVDDEPVLGVIYDFNRDELFSGIPGQGTWLNGEPIQVSDRSDPSQAVLATGFPVRMDLGDQAFSALMNRVRLFKKIRMVGSAAISLAYVACGRFDAYVESDIMLWDIAAGVALIRAAGGKISMSPSPKDRWAKNVAAAGTHSILKAITPLT